MMTNLDGQTRPLSTNLKGNLKHIAKIVVNTTAILSSVSSVELPKHSHLKLSHSQSLELIARYFGFNTYKGFIDTLEKTTSDQFFRIEPHSANICTFLHDTFKTDDMQQLNIYYKPLGILLADLSSHVTRTDHLLLAFNRIELSPIALYMAFFEPHKKMNPIAMAYYKDFIQAAKLPLELLLYRYLTMNSLNSIYTVEQSDIHFNGNLKQKFEDFKKNYSYSFLLNGEMVDFLLNDLFKYNVNDRTLTERPYAKYLKTKALNNAVANEAPKFIDLNNQYDLAQYKHLNKISDVVLQLIQESFPHDELMENPNAPKTALDKFLVCLDHSQYLFDFSLNQPQGMHYQIRPDNLAIEHQDSLLNFYKEFAKQFISYYEDFVQEPLYPHDIYVNKAGLLKLKSDRIIKAKKHGKEYAIHSSDLSLVLGYIATRTMRSRDPYGHIFSNYMYLSYSSYLQDSKTMQSKANLTAFLPT